jgi:uncharacterized protein
MLSFDIRALEQHAVDGDGVLAPDDPIWQEGDPVPSTPLKVTGRLSTAGAGRYYWHGRIEAEAAMPCRRCLAEARAPVGAEEHTIFVEADDEEADNPDVYPLAPGADEIDLRPALREQWLLSVPAFLLCTEDCKGLCPTCGADLNAGACSCPVQESRDPRWDALRALASPHSETPVAESRALHATAKSSTKQRKRG